MKQTAIGLYYARSVKRSEHRKESALKSLYWTLSNLPGAMSDTIRYDRNFTNTALFLFLVGEILYVIYGFIRLFFFA